MTALAATIGNGNIAGVATALTLGGPGSIFWMWVVGLLGMATEYAGSLLAVKFRVKVKKGNIQAGRCILSGASDSAANFKGLAIAFALFGAFAALGIGNSVQSNTIADITKNSFGIENWVTGLIVRHSRQRHYLRRHPAGGSAPLPASLCRSWLFFTWAGQFGSDFEYDKIIPAFALIFYYAFHPVAAAGGFLGIAVFKAQFGKIPGIPRIILNEAGLGTAALIAKMRAQTIR